jgi:hypothetical protein
LDGPTGEAPLPVASAGAGPVTFRPSLSSLVGADFFFWSSDQLLKDISNIPHSAEKNFNHLLNGVDNIT